MDPCCTAVELAVDLQLIEKRQIKGEIELGDGSLRKDR